MHFVVAWRALWRNWRNDRTCSSYLARMHPDDDWRVNAMDRPKKLGGATVPGDGVGPRRAARCRRRRSGVARRLPISTSHPRGTDALLGHLNKGGSSALATNRGDDLCCLRVFRCPMASIRSEHGKIVFPASDFPGAFCTRFLSVARQAVGIAALAGNLGLAPALRRLECLRGTCYGRRSRRGSGGHSARSPRPYSPRPGPGLGSGQLLSWENPS